MLIAQPVTQIIRSRYSCRSYQKQANSASLFHALDEFISDIPAGPFHAPNRFKLVTVNGEDRSSLRGLGTYGAIKDPAGFIIGASQTARMDMEDFGYRMELIVLKAAELGLGTCWLGGNFTRGSFTRKIEASREEILPAVLSVGVPTEVKSAVQIDQSRKRFVWDKLFFLENFNTPLKKEVLDGYVNPLEMVRLAPSARNFQPWRVMKQAENFHFFLQRNKGYHESVLSALLGIADLQRMDMGIAMSHFETAAQEAGLVGHWESRDPGLSIPNTLMEYSITWIPGMSK